jgi:LmbE family N-acetylglucosaminyl deacetylase
MSHPLSSASSVARSGLTQVPWVKRWLRRSLGVCVRSALRLRSRPYVVERNRVALVIAPHQDDETLGCGGLLRQKRLAGAPVWIAYVTDGSASHRGHPTLTPAALAALRQGEARQAMQLLGVEETTLFFLGAGDGTLAHLVPPAATAIAEKIADLLRRVRPDEIFLPLRDDGSSEHDASFVLVQRALALARLHPRLFEFPVWAAWNPLRLFRPLFASRTVWCVDYREHAGLKRQAIGAYVSQTELIAPGEQPALSGEFLSYFYTGREYFFER